MPDSVPDLVCGLLVFAAVFCCGGYVAKNNENAVAFSLW